MEKYLNSVLLTCERVWDICFNVLEEVDDGSGRSALCISSMESVYSMQSLIRGYMLQYPEYFEPSSRIGVRARRFLKCSPEHWLKVKMHSRCFLNESSSVKYLDELPF